MKIKKSNSKKGKLSYPMPVLRILLALIMPFAIFSKRMNIAFAVFLITILIAFFDGFRKRKIKVLSPLWSTLDPFADKLLINFTAISLFFSGMIDLWMVAVFFIKDLLMIIVGLVILLKNRYALFKQNILDKVTTFAQVIALLLVIKGNPDIILLYAAVIMTTLSGLFSLFQSNYQIAKKTDFDEFKFKNLIKAADLVTLLNVVAGLASAYFAINDNFTMAAVMLIIAVIFDTLDGKVARMTKRTGEFGKELDSLADTISFGVAPAIFGYSLIQTNLAIMAFTIFLFAGVLRLARYNIMNISGVFAGMPITLNGLIIPLIFFIQVPINYYPYIYLVLAVLMVSSLRVRKLF